MSLLLGLSAVGAIAVFLAGATIVDDTSSSIRDERAERAMVELAETTTQLESGTSAVGTFEFSGDGGDRLAVDEDAGNVRVVLDHGGTHEIVDEPLGAVRYHRSDGTTYAYQGGGVWLEGTGRARMVETPSFDYRVSETEDATLTFSLVRMEGDVGSSADVTGTLSVTERDDLYPGPGDSNPLEGGEVYVEIESEYCEAWEDHLEERTDSDVEERCSGDGTYTDVGELRYRLVVPTGGVSQVEHAVVAPELDIGGSPGTEVDGDVLVDDPDDVDEDRVTGSVSAGDTALPEIQGEVDDMVAACGSFDDVDTITAPGRHCVSVAAVEDGISVEPTGGKVELVVPGSVQLSGGGGPGIGNSIHVEDGDLVEVYVDGDFEVNSMQAHVGNADDPSQTHVYVTGDVQVSGTDSDHVSAVLYAPHGSFEMNSANSEVHGAVLAQEVSFGGQSRIVYDPAVGDRELDVGSTDEDVTTIYYLHVSETVVSVQPD